MQLHPEIVVEHEDTSACMFLWSEEIDNKKPLSSQQWTWLVLGRVVYLCSPWDNEEQCRTLYHHDNVAVLLALYREKVPQNLVAGGGD
jgi:hypothetical protein